MLLLLFQAVSAIPSGAMLIYDPSGITIGFPRSILQDLQVNAPFTNFLIPGLFLMIFLGLLPLLIVYGLITKKNFKLMQTINLYKNYHWSWTFSYYLGILLVLWICMQLYFGIGFGMLHFWYALLGVLIVVATQWTSTKRDYYISDHSWE
ncbi:hypothetical protein ACFQ1M_16415 [Sungkyunkwania multivorans]|uniref:Uncharacterized protein n=1 Tax=Sungkyunkwania multivorans TaxID=1173618 RepID=A0ABW3D1V5_9FLAO